MRVIEVYETNLPGNRTALKTDAKYTPYVICTNYNPEAKEGSQWDSACGYYTTFASMCKGVAILTMDTEIRLQLIDLYEHCKTMAEDDKYGIWEKDVKALNNIIGN